MPKKKNKKGKQAASVAVNDSSHIPKRRMAGSLLKKKQLDDHDKIGDEKAQLQYFKNEAKRAWKAYMALVLENHMAFLDDEYDGFLNHLEEIGTESERSQNKRLIQHIGDSECAVYETLGEIQSDRELAMTVFADNLYRLEKGESFDSLPLIDPERTLCEVETMIAENFEMSITLTPEPPSCGHPVCSSSGAASIDSAYPDSGELSDRQETPPLQEEIREDHAPYVSNNAAPGPVAQSDRLSDYEWVDDDEAGAIANRPLSDSLNLAPKSTVDAAEILDLLKPIEQAETKAHASSQDASLQAEPTVDDPAIIAACAPVLSTSINAYQKSYEQDTATVHPSKTSAASSALNTNTDAPSSIKDRPQDNTVKPKNTKREIKMTITTNKPGTVTVKGVPTSQAVRISVRKDKGTSPMQSNSEVIVQQIKVTHTQPPTDTLSTSAAKKDKDIPATQTKATTTANKQQEVKTSQKNQSKTETEVRKAETKQDQQSLASTTSTKLGTAENTGLKITEETDKKAGKKKENKTQGRKEKEPEMKDKPNKEKKKSTVHQSTESLVMSSAVTAAVPDVRAKHPTSTAQGKQATLSQPADAHNYSSELDICTPRSDEFSSRASEDSSGYFLYPEDISDDEDGWQVQKKKKPKSEKEPNKQPTDTTTIEDDNEYCHDFYNLGSCQYGDRCKYTHKTKAGSSTAKVKLIPKPATVTNSQATVPHEVTTPMENPAFHGEEGQMRRKIDMCKAYQRGDCTWGSMCNHAHTEQEMKAHRKAYAEWKKKGFASLPAAKPATTASQQVPPHGRPGDNAAFAGEEGQMRKKTDMCRAFQRGDCSWGSDCNYAHNEEECRIAKRAYELYKLCGTVRIVTNSSLKPECRADVIDSDGDLNAAATAEVHVPVGRKWLMCKGYELGLCKRPSNECSYAHHKNELDPELNHVEPCERQLCMGRLRYERRRTTLCPEMLKKGSCIFGKDCTYAHKQKELRPLPKHEMCKRHMAGGHCGGADKCVYAHTRSELRPRPAGEREIILAPGSTSKSNTTTATAAATAKSASSTPKVTLPKQYKCRPEDPNHPQPCRRQFCPGRLTYETKFTAMCTSMRNGRCTAGALCNKAHKQSELRPLPKYEMCSKYGGCGRCVPDNECPYAHSREEQRKPSRPAPAPTEASATSSTQSVRPTSGSALPITRVSNQLNITTRKPIGNRFMSLTDPNDAEAQCSIEEECLICSHKLDERIDLECGHDQWHFRCISKWLNEQRAECPLCNQPAMLPDLFEAPAGLTAADFPSLGL